MGGDQVPWQCIVAITATALLVSLSLPAVKFGLRSLGRRGYAAVGGLYHDKDGAATEESIRAYTDLRPRIALYLSLAIGLAASVASNVLSEGEGWPEASQHYRRLFFASLWCDTASWLLLCLQAAPLPSKNHYLSKFRLTVSGSLSSLVLTVSLALRGAIPALNALADPHTRARVHGLVHLVQVAACLGAVLSFAAFPRRPDVYQDGNLVDRQHTASLLSLFSYSWSPAIFKTAKERQMRLSDIPMLDHETRSRNLLSDFRARQGTGPLWRQLILANLREIVVQWSLTLVMSCLALFPQLALYSFLNGIESRRSHGPADPALFVWVFGLFLTQLLQVSFYNWLRWIKTSRLSVPVLSLLQSLVFSKALQQHEVPAPGQRADHEDGPRARGKTGESAADAHQGKREKKPKDGGVRQSLINHMKLDSNRVTMFCQYNTDLPLSIFKLVLAGFFLTQLLGWKSTLAGLGSACLVTPISTHLSNRYGNLHFSLMRYRDAKAHLLTEALQGMRQIKYSALEQHWEDKILASRNEELEQYWKVSLWQSLLVFIINLGPRLLSCVAFSVYVWEKGADVKASVLFTSLGLFDQLDDAVAMLPLLQMYLVEAWTSCVRLETFLGQLGKEDVTVPGETIAFRDATVSWPKAEDADKVSTEPRDAHSSLKGVTLEFPAGTLSVVTGRTGSGKSLLLAAILGEVKLVSGEIRTPVPPTMPTKTPASIPETEWLVPSLKSFVSQSPWIESGTVRENITFGLPFRKARYNKVLYACALDKDIELLADGDLTEVGPKGVTLSGGQRWRLVLARALYSRAGIIILDDVLSAVDAHVGKHIVEEALTGELASGRTRILATHHAELVMPIASYLVRLHDMTVESSEALTPLGADGRDDGDGESSLAPASTRAASDAEEDGQEAHIPRKRINGLADRADAEEKREVGPVKWKVYKAYYDASGSTFYWLFGIGVLVVARLMPVARNWALKEMAEQVPTSADSEASLLGNIRGPQAYLDKAGPQGTGSQERRVYFWMGAYVVLYLASNILLVVKAIATLIVGMRAARELFQRLTHAILRAPSRWIDTVPSGRILNRFTTDTYMVDRRLAGETFSYIQNVLGLLIVVGTSFSVSLYIIIFGLALLLLYASIASEYVDVAREIKRITSTSQSPIYDQFSSVLTGLSTVRAFGRTDFYMNRMHGLIDSNAKANWAQSVTLRWMGFRMGALGAVFVTAVATAVAVRGVDAALAGFSLTFALKYTDSLTSLLQSMTLAELSFSAAERILEYAEIETEPEGGDDPPAAWPTEGRIEVDNLTISYDRDLPDVLKHVSFTVEAGERIGVVGRTGAGKSTLAAVLFRLLKPKEGTVRIDNVDISSLKLAHLRSRLAIIPQDPFLFSGTLRSNLDMEDKLDDYDLHLALQRVHLTEPQEQGSERPSTYTPAGAETPEATDQSAAVNSVATTPAANPPNIFTDLSHPVSTGGLNLSQGQRQLCCLARALLSRPKILVLDEATSAVDRGTDAAIQASLRREFAEVGCTVLVVAHRLSTVADFDRLLVLDGGRVAEMGTPRELLLAGMGREKADGDAADGTDIAGEVGGVHAGGPDGTGTFWALVQKSAEKEKLIEMILGADGVRKE